MSFFRYPGGKSKVKKKIIEKLSQITTEEYREPFFGGGSIGINFILENNVMKNIWINDKDIGIACLWTSVVKYEKELEKLIICFKPSIDYFYTFKEELLNVNSMPKNEIDIIDIGFKKLVIHQISYSGLGTKSGGPLGGKKQQSKYNIDCRWSPSYMIRKIKKTSDLLRSKEIKYNCCTCLDFQEVIDNLDFKSAIYLDPPYYIKGNSLYQINFSEDDHKRLSNCLEKTDHSWLLSYDNCPKIREMYQWAKIEEIDINYSINLEKNKTTGKKNPSAIQSELVISKGEKHGSLLS